MNINKLAKHITVVILMIAALMSSIHIHAEEYSQRIISLSPVITEEIYLLGAENKLIGTTVYCVRPDEARDTEKVGTLMKADLEKIIILEPDIVLATSLSDLQQIQKLRDIGIRVETFHDAKDLEGICAGFMRLAEILGKEREAQMIIGRVKKKVRKMRDRTEKLPERKVFVQIGTSPLFAATRDSFVNDYITFAGGVNLTADLSSGLYSREKVIESDPDVIIIIGMGIEGAAEKDVWMKYDTLQAVKNDRIYTIEPYIFCSPTPVSFVEALDKMIRILHG